MILKATTLERKNYIWAFAFILPSFLLIILIFLFPIIQIFKYSFGKTAGFNIFNNYHLIFSDQLFNKALLNNLIFLGVVPILVFLSLFISVLLYGQVAGWKIARVFLLFPYVISVPIAGIVFSYLLRLKGPINTIFQFFGLDFLVHDWLAEKGYAIPGIMFVIVWREVGFGVTLFLARLLSVDDALIEAAKIDGASWFQITWKILVPQLVQVIQFYTVIQIIGVFGWLFGYIYTMIGQVGGTRLMWTVDFYIYKMMISYQDRETASAASVILLLVTGLLMVMRYRLSKRFGIDE